MKKAGLNCNEPLKLDQQKEVQFSIMKYSKEFKLECIRKRKAGELIELPPGIKRGPRDRDHFLDQIIRWEKIYDVLGEAGLDHNRTILDANKKLELIGRVEAGESYRSVAASAGIKSTNLLTWHKAYIESGIEGLQSRKKGRKPSMSEKTDTTKKDDSEKTREELLEELQYLRAENEYLKKLDALVQKRKAREQKKK